MAKVGWILLVAVMMSAQAKGQDRSSWQDPPPGPGGYQPAYPDQPMVPEAPTIQRRPSPLRAPLPDPRQPLPDPFANSPLTPQENNWLDEVLMYWERSSGNVKTFDCKFERQDYDPFDPTRVRRTPDGRTTIVPKTDYGIIRYSAPDKALFQIEGEKGEMGEHWACDGKAIYEMDPVRKQMIVHKLPPERQGRAIGEGPIPFLFGAKAANLRDRYYLRVFTPGDKKRTEVWLEAWPRYQADAQNFRYAEMILAIGERSLTPTDIRIHHPNGKNYVVYRLDPKSIAINKNDLREVFGGNPFQPKLPSGWKTVIDEPQPALENPEAPAFRQNPPSVGIRLQNPR